MNMKWLGILVLIFIADMILRKKFPQTWARVQLPINIAVSGLSLIMIVFTVIGTYQVVASDINTASKVLFILFAMAYIAVFVWANYRFWSTWFRKCKHGK